jgi:CubicO group peptidase (beta-lactamase class C family)
VNRTLTSPTRTRLGSPGVDICLGNPEPATNEAKGWIGSAGAIYSTGSDLAAWDLALVSGQVVNPASYALMTTPRLLSDGRTSFYGCGLSWSIRNARTVLSHGGAVAGFVAMNAVPGAVGSSSSLQL